MQAAIYHGKENIQVQDWPEPELSSDEILVKVSYAGICGSDMIIYDGKHPRVVPPRVLGHEVFGSVADAGKAAGPGFRPGDTTLVTGGGPIGNLLAQVLRALGAREVVVSEVQPFRRVLAERMKEIHTTCARVYTLQDCLEAIALLERRSVDAAAVVTDRLSLQDASLAFQRMRGAENCLKILLSP